LHIYREVMNIKDWWNDDWQEKTELLKRKACPSDTLLTTNHMWTAMGLKPRLQDIAINT
jgi:hypothetical protein